MSVYIIDSSRTSQSISAFEDRGLSRGSPTTVTSGVVTVFSKHPVPIQLNLLITYIHMYAMASILDKATFNVEAMNNAAKFFTTFPVRPPTVMVDVKGISETDEFKNLGLKEDPSLKMAGQFMLSSNMSYEQLQKLWRLGIDQFGAAAAGNTNPAGLLFFYYAWKMVALFQTVFGGRILDDAYTPIVPISSKTDLKMEKGVRRLGDVTDDYLEISHPPMNEETLLLYNALTQSDASLLRVVFAPVRSTSTPGLWWSDTSATFTGDGFVFPFFDQMLLPEKDFVFSVILRYFSKCLSDTADGLASLLPILRSGSRKLALSIAGRELQHVFFGIQSAIETGSKFDVIVQGGAYKGFVIRGGNIRVLVGNKFVTPLSSERVTEEVKKLDAHANSVARIVEILSSLDLLERGKGKLAVDQDKARTNARYLANECVKRAWKGSSDEDELRRLLGDLAYDQEYWAITPENVVKILTALLTDTIDETAPFYSGGETFLSSSPTMRILAVFGGKAPTLSIRTGDKAISICREEEANDPNLKTVNGERSLPYLPIYERSLADAADMWDAIKRTHSIRVASAKKAAPGKKFNRKMDVGEIGGDRFLVGYQKLRMWAYSGGAKRARDDFASELQEKRNKKARDEKKAAVHAVESLF
jgi:hypothetical protein